MDHPTLYPYDPAANPDLSYYGEVDVMWASGAQNNEGHDEIGHGNRPHSRSDLAHPPSLQQYANQLGPSRAMIPSDWEIPTQHMNHQTLLNHNASFQQQPYQHQYQHHVQPSSLGFMPISQQPGNGNNGMSTGSEIPMMPAYSNSPVEAGNPLAYMPHDLHNGLVGYPVPSQVQTGPFDQTETLGASPNGSFLNMTPSSDGEWQVVDYRQSRNSFGPYRDMQPGPAVSNPAQSLTIYPDPNSPSFALPSPAPSFTSSFGDDVPFPVASPDTKFDPISGRSMDDDVPSTSRQSKRESKPQGSPHLSDFSAGSDSSGSASSGASISSYGAGSPPPRAKSNPSSKVVKSGQKKLSLKKEPGAPRRVGKRKGPLRPEQREQAGQIRKLRACLRCKCLKKTCDTGDPCAGCKPHHVRNWVVPCTRIDIKDVAYFMKDWKADYERHVTLQFSIANVVGYSDVEHPLWITHGYGYVLPITAREVTVRDHNCFNVDWVETPQEEPKAFDMPTAKLTAGKDGVSLPILMEYLDRHVEDGWERFVGEHFGGTPFLTDLLMTAHRYYVRTQLPIVKMAMKFVLAYNLTTHITLLEGLSDEEGILGKIDDEESKYFGKTLAPVMINFHVKVAMAKMWRDLQKVVLEELSKLFTGVYSGDKLKNWPTIFVLTSLLLIVWEEMQFDAQYRENNPLIPEKFVKDMEDVPAGVIVGLFAAVSQKLPAFSEWNTENHHRILNSNPAACEVMTEVRDNVVRHGNYLKDRGSCKFDRDDFDSLNAKLTSRLVVRAN